MKTRPSHTGRRIPPDNDSLRFDDQRRLRNALRALADLDPGFLWWIEREIPKRLATRYVRLQVERHARLLLVRNYAGMFGSHIANALTYGDLYFTDDGSLKTTL